MMMKGKEEGKVQGLGEEEALLEVVVAGRNLHHVADAAEPVLHLAALDQGLDHAMLQRR